jgi:hypothetical protein
VTPQEFFTATLCYVGAGVVIAFGLAALACLSFGVFVFCGWLADKFRPDDGPRTVTHYPDGSAMEIVRFPTGQVGTRPATLPTVGTGERP